MESKEVKLVSFWASSYGKKVEWALKLKGVEYEYVEEDIFNKSNLLLELNPVHKKVPVLVHGNKPIAESLIILEYIDETWKHQYPLFPQDPYERALARFWAASIEPKLLKAAWVELFTSGDEQENAMKEATEGLEMVEEQIKGKKFFGGITLATLTLQLAAWVELFTSGDEQENAMKEATEGLEMVEEQIKGKKFFGGITLATLTLQLVGSLTGFLFGRKLGLLRYLIH
ncbi:glutathione S-transferase U1-like [Lotus japonicus]|nr:glutathione S-transferase U1-like [Lotus japonicus]